MWRDLIRDLEPAATFAEPVADDALADAEDALGQPIAPHLASLLRECNGVTGLYGLGLVWNVQRIVADNRDFRQNEQFKRLYMPFEPLRFFGDAGNGDQFALLSPPVDRDDVFACNHETDDRRWVAANVETYLRWWLSGKIEVLISLTRSGLLLASLEPLAIPDAFDLRHAVGTC